MKVLILNGSRNPDGQTGRAALAYSQGVLLGGGRSEQILLPTVDIQRCRQCEDNGWGICQTQGRCVIEDDFAGLVEKFRQADAVVFASPVYFSNISESLRAFLDRLRRVCINEEGRKGIAGKSVVGICVAGGSGGGAPRCCADLDFILLSTGLVVVDMYPVRRMNLDQKIPLLKQAGEALVRNIKA